MVDWSASRAPKLGRDSIWIAWALADERSPQRANPPTRRRALDLVRGLLHEAVERNLRVLVGFDFAYAYPRGFARALGREETDSRKPWRYVWDQIAKRFLADATQDGNANDRFRLAGELNAAIAPSERPGPFWACPERDRDQVLLPTKPAFPYAAGDDFALDEYRSTETRLREHAPSIQSTWKLYTSGSVGSQVLLGIPIVRALRDDPKLAEASRVWPFETGFTAAPLPPSGPFVLHAEIWPGILGTVDEQRFGCRDEAQVVGLVSTFRGLDSEGGLGTMFERPAFPAGEDAARCIDEEGWILGAGIPDDLRSTLSRHARNAFAAESPPPATW